MLRMAALLMCGSSVLWFGTLALGERWTIAGALVIAVTAGLGIGVLKRQQWAWKFGAVLGSALSIFVLPMAALQLAFSADNPKAAEVLMALAMAAFGVSGLMLATKAVRKEFLRDDKDRGAG